MECDGLSKASLLKNLMDNMPDSIYFKDRDSRFIMLNQAAAQWQGFESSDKAVGKSDFDTYREKDARQMYAAEQQIVKTGEPLIGLEEKQTWKDGQEAWVSTTKVPLRDREGNISGTLGISRDITEHKKAEIRAVSYAKEIKEIKEEMEEDLRMAGELQKTFFSGRYPAFPEDVAAGKSCVEFLHRFESCSDVSGDYCSIRRVSNTEAGIFMCDIRSTGVRAALGSALVRGIVQEISQLGLEPGAYLSRMNELLIPLLRHDDVLLNISASYMVLDVVTGTVRYAGSGHSVPILIPHKGEARELFGMADLCGPALAVQADAAYCTVTCRVVPGDSVVLFTDGLCCVKNRHGEMFGSHRLLESARCLDAESLAGIFQGLEDSATAFAGGSAFTDDVCLGGFQLRRYLSVSE